MSVFHQHSQRERQGKTHHRPRPIRQPLITRWRRNDVPHAGVRIACFSDASGHSTSRLKETRFAPEPAQQPMPYDETNSNFFIRNVAILRSRLALPGVQSEFGPHTEGLPIVHLWYIDFATPWLCKRFERAVESAQAVARQHLFKIRAKRAEIIAETALDNCMDAALIVNEYCSE